MTTAISFETEPDAPWVMVGKLVCWASQPHGVGEGLYQGWVTSDRDINGVMYSRTFDDWGALWIYAGLHHLPITLPGEQIYAN